MIHLRTTLCLILLSFTIKPIVAQQVRPLSSVQIYEELQQLQRLGTVMYIAAHPDDENTRLISYLVHHDYVRTVYLSLTRGDGGQNIIGDEQGAALGLIRTYEMMEARRIDGAEQLFTRFVDFGFTKSPDETFDFWDKQVVVADIKKAIQQYRPDVLICRFPTTGEGGHGQHTASAIAALEAFNQLAVDRNPEVWKPKRILFNAFRFGSSNTLKEDQFKITIGQYNPLLGESYGEMAGRSRSEHKSQGAGTPQGFGEVAEHFELMAGAPMQKSLYDDLDTSWARIGHPEIGNMISKIINEYDFAQPNQQIPNLLVLRKAIEKIKDGYWRDQKLKDLDQLILSAAGLQIEALSSKSMLHVGDQDTLDLNIISRIANMKLLGVSSPFLESSGKQIVLGTDQIEKIKLPIAIPKNWPITEPYWMSTGAQHNQYQYVGYYNEPVSRNPLQLKVKVLVHQQPFEVFVPVSYKTLNPTKGDVIEAVKITPTVDIQPNDPLILVNRNENPKVQVAINPNSTGNGKFIIQQDGKRIFEKKIEWQTGRQKIIVAELPFSSLTFKSGAAQLDYLLIDQDEAVIANRKKETINYDHIPSLQYFQKAGSTIKIKDWKTVVKKIGYIEGAGDKVAETLTQMGFDVISLTNLDLQNPALLSSLEAIVCGVRFLNTRPDMQESMPLLLAYVRNGGTLIYQYNTNSNMMLKDYLPFPLKISRNRVTDENAAMHVLDAKDRLLHYPNKITSEDFLNWVQERGLYYPDEWDSKYKAVFASHDAGEQQLNGGHLYAPYGNGFVIYTGLSFFRQLPAANIGAMRLFVNILNIGR